jgi:AI-2 transport protein TqsA
MALADLHLRTHTARNALVVIAVVVAGAAFFWLSGILTPLALAIFLLVMIDSFARVLVKRVPHFPAALAQPVAIALSVGLVILTIVVVADNATAFAGQIKTYLPKLNALVGGLAAAMGMARHPTAQQLINQLNPSSYIGVAADHLKGFATTAVAVLLYLGFLIASRQSFPRKAVMLFGSDATRHEAAEMFQRIRNGVERYLWIQVVCGMMMAIPAFAVMTALGLDNAIFWAFLIFIVGFIPIIGGAIGVLGPPLFALVQFDTPWRALILLGALEVMGFIIGNIIYPRMQGKSLNIDPIAVLLSLAFWGAIWGLPGMFLSTPLTVMTMIILAQFDGSRWIAILLSSDGEPLGPTASVSAPGDPATAALPGPGAEALAQP